MPDIVSCFSFHSLREPLVVVLICTRVVACALAYVSLCSHGAGVVALTVASCVPCP